MLRWMALLPALWRFGVYVVRHASPEEIERAAKYAADYDPDDEGPEDGLAHFLQRLARTLRWLRGGAP